MGWTSVNSLITFSTRLCTLLVPLFSLCFYKGFLMDVCDHFGLAAHTNLKGIEFHMSRRASFWLGEDDLRHPRNLDDNVFRWMTANRQTSPHAHQDIFVCCLTTLWLSLLWWQTSFITSYFQVNLEYSLNSCQSPRMLLPSNPIWTGTIVDQTPTSHLQLVFAAPV